MPRYARPVLAARRRAFFRRVNRRVHAAPTKEGPAVVWRSLRRFLPTLALVILIGGVTVGGRHYFSHSPHFALRALHFSGMQNATDEKLSTRAQLRLGGNLFAIDLRQLERRLGDEPWVKNARAHVELPSTIAVEIEERRAACLVALGSLYLADEDGFLFKRASSSETSGLVVVTGLSRSLYESDETATRAEVKSALKALRMFSVVTSRPIVGEVNLDRTLGVTLFTAEHGVGIRLGRIDETLPERIDRFDTVWASLQTHGERPRMLYLDNRTRPDRVAVKLADSANATTKGRQ